MNSNHSVHSQASDIKDALRRCSSAFMAAGAFSFAINLLLLAPSLYMLQVYDRVLTSRNATTLLMLSIILLGLLIFEATLEFFRSRIMCRVSVALDLELSPRVFDATFQRLLHTQTAGPASATQALNDLTNVRQFLTAQGLFAFFDAPWTPVYLAVIFLLSPWMGLMALVGAVALVFMALLTEHFTASILVDANRQSAAANACAAGHLRNSDAIEAMGMLHAIRERWFERQLNFLALQASASDRAAVISAITRFLRLALQSGILGLGAYLVMDNQMTPGGMIAASILLGRALAPVESGISSWRNFVSARGAYARLSTLLQAHPAPSEALTLPRPGGDIRAENLTIGVAATQTLILKNINFRTPAGAMVAVVGPSGSGKSTLTRALAGTWRPASGTLRLDGADVHSWDKAQLGPCIGYLPQGVALLDGTVADNISRFGRRDDHQVVNAARMAGVHELILRLPKGYDTPLGDVEGGVTLSGGQRQRVGLARALYGNPALLVLDEPNANLDEAGDAALLKALREVKHAKRTTFVVTHRRNILEIADFILVLVDGTIQKFGTRETMLDALMPTRQPATAALKGQPA